MKRNSYEASRSGQRTIILVMTIEIGDGRRDTIEVAEDDEPDLLAKAFCKRHNLPRDFIEVLASQIEANIDKILEEEAQEDWTFAEQSGRSGKFESTNRDEGSEMPSEVAAHETLSAQFQLSACDNSQASQSSRSTVNSCAGERLYYLGVMKKELNAQWREKQMQRLDEQASKDLTFRPKINTRSKSLARNHRKAEECYIEQQRKKAEGIERRKGQSLIDQQVECTFVPRVNPNSSVIMRNRSTQQRNAFVSLYSEAYQRQQRLKEAKDSITKEQCPFKPSINSSYSNRSVKDRELIERLVNSRMMVESNLKRIRDKQAALVDAETGQEYFRPKIGRAPKLDRNVENLPIGDYLFNHGVRDVSKFDGPPASIELISRPRTTQIVEKLKITRFKELFELLNPDENGEIESHKVEPEKLSAELLTVLFPLLEELEQLGEPINFQEFSEAMENLILTLTPGDKSIILVPRKAPQQVTEPPHYPQINEFRPTTYRQKQLSKLPLYERMAFLTQDRKRRIEQAKTKKQEAELDQCTFHPKIKAYRLADPYEEALSDQSYEVKSHLRYV